MNMNKDEIRDVFEKAIMAVLYLKANIADIKDVLKDLSESHINLN